MKEENRYKHWVLTSDDHNFLWLALNKADASTNTLDKGVLLELEDIHDEIASVGVYKGLVIFSEKVSGFIAGADINEFTELKNQDEAFELVSRGQLILNKIAALPIPTVAIVNGFCLGGGFELALACDFRIAVDNVKTRLGLPEVLLGIQPGWGGTVRLPKLIGAHQALPLMFSGRTMSASVAHRLGAVDFVVAERESKRAATDVLLGRVKPVRLTWLPRLTNAAWFRPLLGRLVSRQLTKKVNPVHYPSPFSVLYGWQKYGVNNHEAFTQEAQALSILIFTDTASHLVRAFFLKERLKSLAKNRDFHPKHVHVIGAGVMGGDIATWCAHQGMIVTLQDRAPEYIAPAISRAYDFCKKKLKKRRLVQEVMDRLIPDEHGKGVACADIIIEAVYEDVQAKQDIFSMLEQKARPDAILASNTSSIPIDEIASVLDKPERLVGIHFFNPVAKMQLVEIVRGDFTSDAIVNDVIAFARQLNRLPLPVKSHPGFLINRILMPYLMEAVRLLEEGMPAAVIDKVAMDFGMPMGPVELADTVGLDVCLSVANNLAQQFNRTVPDVLQEKVDAGHLGRKSGQGFYRFRGGKPVKERVKGEFAPHNEISERLVMLMLNEAVACLWEGVVEDSDLLDAGMIFGTGFAPFRGGPIQYIRDCGVNTMLTTLKALATQYGKRFEPHQGWETVFTSDDAEKSMPQAQEVHV